MAEYVSNVLLFATQSNTWWTMCSVALAAALPLFLAAIGGLYSERSGIINIGLEGMMLAGAFAAGVWGVFLPEQTLFWTWFGVLLAGIAGMALAWLHAIMCIKMRADQIISGVALNILVLQGTIFLSMFLFGGKGGSPAIPTITDWGVGPLQLSPLLLLGVVALVGTSWLLWQTPFGLRLRACGEHPEAARSAGIPVAAMQLKAVLISGFLAGLGGAVLLHTAGRFGKEMTAGRGYIALAALIFGGWRPTPVLGACLFFGVAFALKDQLSAVTSWQLAPEWLTMLPYALALLALCGFVGQVKPPADRKSVV